MNTLSTHSLPPQRTCPIGLLPAPEPPKRQRAIRQHPVSISSQSTLPEKPQKYVWADRKTHAAALRYVPDRLPDLEKGIARLLIRRFGAMGAGARERADIEDAVLYRAVRAIPDGEWLYRLRQIQNAKGGRP